MKPYDVKPDATRAEAALLRGIIKDNPDAPGKWVLKLFAVLALICLQGKPVVDEEREASRS